jgi:hypothetical protein
VLKETLQDWWNFYIVGVICCYSRTVKGGGGYSVAVSAAHTNTLMATYLIFMELYYSILHGNNYNTYGTVFLFLFFIVAIIIFMEQYIFYSLILFIQSSLILFYSSWQQS